MRHFTLEEFRCPCCGRAEMAPYFLQMLDEARERAGVPFVVASGFRCPRHNAAVGGRPHSAHLRGLAADISCRDSRLRAKIILAAAAVGFKRMGIASTFVHLDADPQLPHPALWLYPHERRSQ